MAASRVRSSTPAAFKEDDLGLLYAAVEHLPAGMLVYLADGSLSFINRRGRAILDLPAASPMGGDIESLLGVVPHRLRAPRSVASDSVRNEFILLAPHARPRHIGYEARPLRTSRGDRQAYVVLFQDVSHLQSLRQERERDLLFDSVSRLLPMIAHEIKNPLSAIQTVVEVLIGDLDGHQHQRDLEAILNEVTRLRLLVDRMGLADQRLVSASEAVDLVPSVRHALQLVSTRAGHRRVDLVYAGAERLRASIHPDLLLTILHNLLNNALDACQPGAEVTISMESSPAEFTLSVIDTGEGMTTDTLRRATDLFFTTRDTGSGIGLALIREIVERSGGTLTICSEEGKGTQVTIVIPWGPQ